MIALCRPLLGLTALATLAGAIQADWPGFRGPQALGVSDERGLPVKWGPQENVVWKTKLPGPGASSPIVWGDRVFLTCFTGYALTRTKPGDIASLRRHLLCIDRISGKVLWQTDTAPKLPETTFESQVNQHGYATSTPVTDGERVFVFYGTTGVFAYDLAGKQLWHAEVGKGLNGWGSAASPVLYRNLVLINAGVESRTLVALDKASGKEVWRAKLTDDCWSTPVVVELPGGKRELVVNAGTVMGFDPEKGEELWRCDGPLSAAAGTPVVKGDVLFVMGASFGSREVLAVKAGGRGDVTRTHVLWKQDKAGAGNCSPVLAGDRLYYFSNQAACLRIDTGEVLFQERLAGLGPEYASPVAADGKLYLFTRKGAAHVLAARDKLETLAQNDLGDPTGFTASPAVSHGMIFVRSNEYLYCLGEKK